MTRPLPLALLGLLLATPAPGLAADAKKGGKADTEEDADEGSVTGKRPPPLAPGAPAPSVLNARDVSEMADRPYDNVTYIGAEILKMDPAFVDDARKGLELIYLRDYKAAKGHFDRMTTQYPAAAVGPVGNGLIWQALMLENFDFKYESQWETSFKVAKDRLDAAFKVPGEEAWEYFLHGGVVGIEAIHMTRHGQFLQALNRGLDALRSLGRAKDAAPSFPDLLLGDGIYNYWRSVVTLNSDLLPDFEDKRAEGIAQIQRAEAEGIFVAAPATLALTFSYLEERDLKRALGSAMSSRKAYPDNVINNLIVGRINLYMRRYPQAEGVFNEVLADAPTNERAHYYLSIVYSRTRRLDQAITSMEKYLAFDLLPEYRSSALYRHAGYFYRKQDYRKARELYQQAWDLTKNKAAKRRLESMEKMKKEGRISY